MEFTGERFVPTCRGEIAAEHYHRYFFAAGLVAGKRVVDIACGEGYGTHILARSAARVTGVDVSPEAVAHASRKYGGERLTFLEGNAADIPLPDASADAAVSFETLEHLREQEEMLREIKRVLRKDGLLIISTPNKSLYRRAEDRFHVKELFREDFLALLQRHFLRVALLGQKIAYGSLLGGTDGDVRLLRQREGHPEADALPLVENAKYFIALGTDGTLPETGPSFFEYPLEHSDVATALRERFMDLRERHDALRTRHEALQTLHRATEAAHASLLASRSWRLTAPLRRLRHFLRREDRSTP